MHFSNFMCFFSRGFPSVMVRFVVASGGGIIRDAIFT